jgi:hypothetical protein
MAFMGMAVFDARGIKDENANLSAHFSAKLGFFVSISDKIQDFHHVFNPLFHHHFFFFRIGSNHH